MRWFFIILLLVGCKKEADKSPSYTYYPIQGREETLPSGKVVRHPLYRVKVPVSWTAQPTEGSLQDTTKPNICFLITPQLSLAVHSFPNASLETRIPAAHQVARWQSQDKTTASIAPVHHDGFVGFSFATARTLAWSLQLDPELYQRLSLLGRTHEENSYLHQMRSDVTIKVSGPPEEIAAHHDEIKLFADSLQLFQPIPNQ